jgi:anaerobic magnesium-protoporphyrin IX monomethyl ester cyclase
MQPLAPLGTLYAASYLRERGYDVTVFDAMLAESDRDWERLLDRHRPHFAVLYEDNFNYLSKMCLLRMRSAAFAMIEMARARGCTVIVAGSDATDHAAAYIDRGAEFVLVGEGEETLLELLDRLTGKTPTPPDAIKGLVFADRSGATSLVRTPRRPDLKALDALPFPAWDLVDVARYRELWRQRHGYFSMNMATTRGCPYHCNWCAKPIWGQRYNQRSPENVVDEIVWLKATYGPDHLTFADDIFGLKPGWIARFADVLAARAGVTPFKCLSRADVLLRDGEIAALKRAGCRTVWIGAESGSQAVLDAMEKGIQVDEIRAATRAMHEVGIEVGFFLQFGYPGETRRDIEATLRLVRECQPDDIGVSVSYPLPGTRFFDAVSSELGAKRNWTDSEDLAMMYQGPFSTDFYRKLHTVLHKEFRGDRFRRELHTLARHPSRVRWHHLRRAAATLYGLCSLPVDRIQLDRLGRVPHTGVTLAQRTVMQREAAAQPTPQ